MRAKIVLPSLIIFSTLILSVSHSGQDVRRITYNGVSVDVVIDRPALTFVDVMVAYHGTVMSDDQIVPAAINTLNRVKEITARNDIMFVSVAYPQEHRLLGDGIREAEAALLWVKKYSRKALKKKISKIFLIGHSQGADTWSPD